MIDMIRATVVYLAFIATIILAGIKGSALIIDGYPDFASDFNRSWHASNLPENIGVSEVIAAGSSYDTRESCLYTLYRLDGLTLTAIRDNGLAYLGTEALRKKDGRKNPYGAWHATPVVMNEDGKIDINGRRHTLSALSANYGCETGFEKPPQWKDYTPKKALRESGNFYAVANGGAGMILIDTNAGVALFLYNG